MLFYLVLLFLVACFSAGVSYTQKGYLIYIFKIITLALLVVPATIRYGIGVDYFNYIDLFQTIVRGGANYLETGYWLLNVLVYQCGGKAQLVLAIAAFLTAFFAFKDLSEKRWHIYSILFILVVYSWYFTTVRQMLAASIAFYALRIIEEKEQTFKALILIGFAFLFHASALIYPFIYLIGRRIYITRLKALCTFLAVFIVTFILSSYLTQYITMLAALTSYGGYANSEWFLAADAGSGLANLTRYVLFFFLLAFFPLKKENWKNRLTYNILLLYIIFEVMSAQITILNRISRGLTFILFPVIWEITQTKSRYGILINLCIYFLILIYFIAGLINKNPNLLPYKTCF